MSTGDAHDPSSSPRTAAWASSRWSYGIYDSSPSTTSVGRGRARTGVARAHLAVRREDLRSGGSDSASDRRGARPGGDVAPRPGARGARGKAGSPRTAVDRLLEARIRPLEECPLGAVQCRIPPRSGERDRAAPAARRPPVPRPLTSKATRAEEWPIQRTGRATSPSAWSVSSASSRADRGSKAASYSERRARADPRDDVEAAAEPLGELCK